MSFGTLMAFARQTWPAEQQKNGSILKAMLRRWPESEVEAMVHGAQLLGWTSLLALNAAEGMGRRMAIAKYWSVQNQQRKLPQLESLGAIFKAKGLV